MNIASVLPHLDPATYRRHTLHADARDWVEKNCYVDIWIEALHALGCEPLAIMPHAAAIDFDGDQWTFFKPPHGELRELYGIDVQELNVWRPLIEHAAEHLGAGRFICTEADAFWLPDTSGTDYRRQHTKSSVILNALDVAGRRLGYFHNAAYYALAGEDFARTFRLDAAPEPTFMPLYAELVKIDALVKLPPAQLARHSRELWRRHMQRRPQDNPVRRFQQRFERDLPALQEAGLNHYHAWAFATTRQLGAAFEAAAQNLKWLKNHGHPGVEPAALAFAQISDAAKTFILKGARAATSKRMFDGAAMFDLLADAWHSGMKVIDAWL
ncbi:MAG: DUF1839 family protein [Steroidobacterales bacterium]